MFLSVPGYNQHFHVTLPYSSSREKSDPVVNVCVPLSIGGLSRQPNSVAREPEHSRCGH